MCHFSINVFVIVLCMPTQSRILKSLEIFLRALGYFFTAAIVVTISPSRCFTSMYAWLGCVNSLLSLADCGPCPILGEQVIAPKKIGFS